MFGFKSEKKNEKIYKFIYYTGSGYGREKKTTLLTACTPVQAVQKFNKMTDNKLYDIVEFTEVVHKTEESKE